MKKIEYILKNNLIIQKVYSVVFTIIFRFIGLFVKVDKNLILFNSFSGKSYNDSPKVLYESIKSNSDFKNFRFVWSFNKPEKFNKIVNCKVVKQDSFKYFITVLKAGFWVTNVNIERGLKLQRKGNYYINTWHGTGPKTSGNLVKKRNDYNFQKVNAILTTCDYHEDLFLKGFNAKKESFYRFGRPREDYLFDVVNCLPKEREKILRQYSLPLAKKYILFAPTWRETKDKGRTYGTLQLFDLEKWINKLGDDYIILFRAHSITNSYKIPENKSILDVTGVSDINELYVIADYLVSDYSSCFTDFSILRKPMFCYAPDYDEYVSNRGILFDLNKYFVDGVIKDEEILLKAIKNVDYGRYSKKTAEFKEEFQTTSGGATSKTIELILKNYKNETKSN